MDGNAAQKHRTSNDNVIFFIWIGFFLDLKQALIVQDWPDSKSRCGHRGM